MGVDMNTIVFRGRAHTFGTCRHGCVWVYFIFLLSLPPCPRSDAHFYLRVKVGRHTSWRPGVRYQNFDSNVFRLVFGIEIVNGTPGVESLRGTYGPNMLRKMDLSDISAAWRIEMTQDPLYMFVIEIEYSWLHVYIADVKYRRRNEHNRVLR